MEIRSKTMVTVSVSISGSLVKGVLTIINIIIKAIIRIRQS